VAEASPPEATPPEAIRHERMAGAGLTLHVARAGRGEAPPVILLHGFPEHWRSWRRQLPVLAAAGHSVLAPDLRGYDRSDRPASRRAYHLRHLVDDVAALVRATGHARAHVVGHDWGGLIAWAFAGAYPELLDRLVVMNAPHLELYLREVRRPPQLFMSWYVLFFQLPRLPELALARRDFAAVRRVLRYGPRRRDAFSAEDVEAYVDALRPPGALTAALDYYRVNMRPSGARLARRARTDAETLVIWGEQDRALSTRLLDGLERVAPRVRVERIPEAGHWVQNEAPERVNRLLVDFLAPRSDG